MTRMFYMFAEMITPIVLMPMIMFCYGKRQKYGIVRVLYCMMFSLYLSFVFHLTGQPDLLYHRFEPNVNLILSGEILADFRNGILNILLFVPLGFFLPVLGEKYRRVFRAFLFGLCMSVLIELLQMFTLRATDINDVLTNTVGTLLGWLLWRGVSSVIYGLQMKDRGKDILFCCASTYFVMFFIQPFTYTALWNLVMH